MGVIWDFICDIWSGIVDFCSYALENLDLVAFLILAAVTILAALYVVHDKEVMHSAFYLALVFLCNHHPVRIQRHVDKKIHSNEGG